MSKKRTLYIFLIIFVFAFFLIIRANAISLKDKTSAILDSTENQNLKFVQLTDVHIDLKRQNSGKRLFGLSVAMLQDAISQINRMKDVDFVIFSGDSINTPQESYLVTFSKIASQLKCPWYVALGNHDVGVNSSFNKNKFYEILNKYNKYESNTLPYYSFVPKKGYLVLMLDGVIDSRITAHGYFPAQELKWVEAQLENNKDSKVIIVQHFPLVEPSKSNDHFILNKKEYLDILSRYNNVIAVISGHYHIGKITKVGNTVHISTPALIQSPNGFRVITINNQNNDLQMSIELKRTNLKNAAINNPENLADQNKIITLHK